MIINKFLNIFRSKQKNIKIIHANFGGILFKEWMKDGVLHRDDGPAVTNSEGDEEWYRYGKRHREDGPAVISFNGKLKQWWINGKQLNQEQFEFNRQLNQELPIKQTKEKRNKI